MAKKKTKGSPYVPIALSSMKELKRFGMDFLGIKKPKKKVKKKVKSNK